MIAIFKEVSGRVRSAGTVAVLAVCLLVFLFAAGKEKKEQDKEAAADIQAYMAAKPLQSTVKCFFPIFAFVGEGTYGDAKQEMMSAGVLAHLPFYRYGFACQNLETEQEDRDTFALLMEAESRDEETRLQEEAAQEETPEPQPEETKADGTEDALEGSMEEMMLLENETAAGTVQMPAEFIKHDLQYTYDWEALKNYDILRSTFYAFAETTGLDADFLNIEKLQKDLSIDKTAEGPQILIYHTHSQEAFADSVPGDESMTIQGVGEHLAQILRDDYGYQVLHHTGQYDVQTRDNAYSRALPEIEQILADNPSIQVVIDLHRDASNPKREMVVDVDGRPTAKFMFFNGISRTKKNGEIKYLYNPNLEDNLAFSFQMQVKAGEYYPGLTRKIYVREYRYNMHVKPRTLLIELGDNSNTVQEVMNACDPIAHILDLVINPEK